MPTEEITTQVAPASDPADTGAAQAEQAQVTQEAAAGANGETTPEPDVKAELEKTRAELAQERTSKLAAEKRAADAENLVRTQAGAQSAGDRRLNRLEQQIQRHGEILKAGLTTPDASAEITRLETVHQNEDRASFSDFVAEQGRNNTVALGAAGFTNADISNEELADGLAIWDAAAKIGDREGIERASKSLARGIKRMQAAKQVEKPITIPVRTEPVVVGAATNGAGRRIPNMDTGTGVGAANISMNTLVERYGADYDSLSPDQRKRAEDYMRREGLI